MRTSWKKRGLPSKGQMRAKKVLRSAPRTLLTLSPRVRKSGETLLRSTRRPRKRESRSMTNTSSLANG